MIFGSSNSSVSHFRSDGFLNLPSLNVLCIETHLYLYFGHVQSLPYLCLLFDLLCCLCSFLVIMGSLTHLFIGLGLYSSVMSNTNFHAFFDSLSLGLIMEIYYSSNPDLFYHHFEELSLSLIFLLIFLVQLFDIFIGNSVIKFIF